MSVSLEYVNCIFRHMQPAYSSKKLFTFQLIWNENLNKKFINVLYICF